MLPTRPRREIGRWCCYCQQVVPFPSRFPLAALAAGLAVSAVLLVAASFSDHAALIGVALIAFVGIVTASALAPRPAT